MSTTQAVHWHEGMFLRPHHFLLADRHTTGVIQRGVRCDVHHYWGLRSAEIDLDALSNFRFVVRSLRARLRDGTNVVVPEDGVLPDIDLKEPLEKSGTGGVMLHLAVPVYHPGRANVSAKGAESQGEAARYRLDTLSIEDENLGTNPQSIQVRRLNLTVLPSTRDLSGYDHLPIGRVVRSTRAEATPELDPSYIPPVLACEAWPKLSAGILQSLHDRIGKRIEVLASQAVSRRIGFDSQSQGDRLIMAQLRELNEAYAYLGILAFTEGIHPLDAYLELARLIGKLSFLDMQTRRPPALPRYDHDDLGTCFFRAKQYLDGLLDLIVEPDYKERPFFGVGLRMQVTLEPHWLEPSQSVYIGVQSSLDVEACVRLLTKPGQLDMKIGSSDRVDAIFRNGQAGLRFDHAPRPPRALPTGPGQIYFQVSRDSPEGEWQHVQRSLTLALRLNENLIAGDIQGRRTLSIRNEGQMTTLDFTLYVVPNDS